MSKFRLGALTLLLSCGLLVTAHAQGNSPPQPSGLVWAMAATPSLYIRMLPASDSNFFVLWDSSGPSGAPALWGQLFGPDGAAKDGSYLRADSIDHPELWDACTDRQGGFYLASVQKGQFVLQHINGQRQVSWVKTVSTAGAQVTGVVVAEDNNGGLDAAWAEQTPQASTVWAQRLNSAGQPQWPLPGVGTGQGDRQQSQPNIIPDGQGGAIVEWRSAYNGINRDRVQRVSKDGKLLWEPIGIDVHPAVGDLRARLPLAAPGGGGVVAAWTQGVAGLNRIFYQYVDPQGQRAWPVGGITTNPPTNEQWNPVLLGSGKGHLWISWEEVPATGTQKLMIVRRDPPRGAKWAAGDVAMATTPGGQGRVTLELDGVDGVMAAWLDNRTDTGIYLQDISGHGQRLYGDGILVAGGLGRAQRPHLLLLPSHRAAVTWAEDLGDNRWYMKRSVVDLPVSK